MLTGEIPKYSDDEKQQLAIPSTITGHSYDLLTRLLNPDPKDRLRDTKAIQSHPFFESIDWESIDRKDIPSPYESTIDAGDDFLDEEEFQEVIHPIDYNNLPSLLQGVTFNLDSSGTTTRKKKENRNVNEQYLFVISQFNKR